MTTTDPTRRRLQALACIGHTPTRIAHGTGIPTWAVLLATTNDRYTLTTRHRDAANAYYQAHQDHPVTGPEADRTRADARTARWAAPAAWDDIDTDPSPTGHLPCTAPDCQRNSRYADGYCAAHHQQARRGAPTTPTRTLTIPDHDTVIRLTRQGMSAREIAERLGVTERTVTRHRTKETAA